MNETGKNISLTKELSQFWLCPYDQNILQERQSRVAQNPNFFISRGKVDIGVSNAIAMKKIPEQAGPQTAKIANFIFEIDNSKRIVEFVSVTCKKCGKWLSAPRLSKVEGIDITHVHSIMLDNKRTIYYGKYTKICQHCQKENQLNYKYCIHCGSQILEGNTTRQRQVSSWEIQNLCAHCKREIRTTYLISNESPGKKFCSNECRKEYLNVLKSSDVLKFKQGLKRF